MRAERDQGLVEKLSILRSSAMFQCQMSRRDPTSPLDKVKLVGVDTVTLKDVNGKITAEIE